MRGQLKFSKCGSQYIKNKPAVIAILNASEMGGQLQPDRGKRQAMSTLATFCVFSADAAKNTIDRPPIFAVN